MNKDTHKINETYEKTFGLTKREGVWLINFELAKNLIRNRITKNIKKYTYIFNDQEPLDIKVFPLDKYPHGPYFLGIYNYVFSSTNEYRLTTIHDNNAYSFTVAYNEQTCFAAFKKVLDQLNQIDKSLNNQHKINLDI